jgi:hypothetical protein
VNDALELKPISRAAIPLALEKAERYRLLNEPEQAESICRDVLEVEPDHQPALVVLILAMTDQFGRHEGSPGVQQVQEYARRLSDEYQRLYYGALIREREARALLGRSPSKVFAYDGLREAMEWYERAEPLRPPGNDDAILRWNACVRTIRRAHLQRRVEEPVEQPLE